MVSFSPVGLEQRAAAFLAAEHEVLDADVGEGAAGHDAVVAAARAVAVEVLEGDAGVRSGSVPAGRGLLDGAGRARCGRW